MFLKSLTLKGFKSFADTTVLEMEPGVTVVVGPNGSGKSNIVDAIAWVLGAQAPSAVRSKVMEDVIFNGTDKRQALGRAEVSLTFDNSAGLLPLEFTEITISRTLFRNGDSEYALNGVECRLLDIQELLSDAGVGRQQHVIVSQGQIDAVLNARPEDRRAIIEEAAGVLKYRKRKERAERRLDSTEANLLRVQDLIREVRRQLRPLERQADAARRHGEVVQELRALKLFLSGREIAGLRSRLQALTGEKVDGTSKENEIRQRLAQLDTAVMALEAELTARGDSGVSDELVKVEQLRERARGLSALLAERKRSMERDRTSLMAEDMVASLEAESTQLRAELDEVRASLVAADLENVSLTADEAQFEEERARTSESGDVSNLSSQAASAAAEVRGELRSLRNTAETDMGEIQRATSRVQHLDERDAQFTAEVERLQSELAVAEVALDQLKSDVEDADDRVHRCEMTLDGAQQALITAQTQAARRAAHLEFLRNAASLARARDASASLSDVQGVVGALFDTVSIDDGYADAVLAALGEAVSAVVVSDTQSGRRALESMRRGVGTGFIAPLGVMPTVASTPPDGVRAVRAVVRAASHAPVGVDALLDVLLGGVGLVDTLDDAIALVASQPNAVVVTRAGDRVSASGWRVGAADDAGGSDRIVQAESQATAAQVELDRRTESFESARNELGSARAALVDLQRQLSQQSGVVEGASDALTRVVNDMRAASTERQLANDAISVMRGRLAEHQRRVAELEAILPALEESEAREAAAAQALSEVLSAIDSRASLLAIRRRDLEVRIAGLREREQIVYTRHSEVEQRLAADVTARTEAAQRRERVDRSLLAITRLESLVNGHRASTEVRVNELQELRRRQSDEVRTVALSLDDSRRSRQASEKELEEHRERMRRVETEETETRMRLEAAVETLRRELEVEPEAAEASPMPEVPEGTSHVERARALERDLRLMGPINPLALEEFTALQQRHQFLDEQLTDVRNTRRELMQIIKAVDEEIQSVFANAFTDVSQNFTFLFNMLFPGGKGKLVLTNPTDMLNTGIEVEASPPGKNVKKLSLLSGGERSLTALAYLFAVFRSRPSPFYVMDEVEAALDDVNLHRFLGLVNEFRRTAQLIIVSHQKRTMEAGDVLLGVSMQPGGSSKVLVERAADVVNRDASNSSVN